MGEPMTCVFSHGKESGPWGSKIERLAEVARAKGLAVESVDYREIPDPEQRVERLVEVCSAIATPIVLVGSSLGGYVSTVASERIQPVGMFLMAPALYYDGFENLDPIPYAGLTDIVHGWSDEVVPVEQSLEFSRRHGTVLHLVESDHRLIEALPFVAQMFESFLDRIDPRIPQLR
jgi:predicted alpha/beta hydrolase family esterase